MRASFRPLLALLPALGLLAACASPPPPPMAAMPPPPPPAVSGALVAPQVSVGGQVFSGSSMPPAAPIGAMRLSASDTLALLANNTAIGLTDAGIPYIVYFANNGSERFREASMIDGGTWRVLPNGEFCSQLPNVARGAENCYILARYGNVILFQRADGLAIGSVRVVAGDPQGL